MNNFIRTAAVLFIATISTRTTNAFSRRLDAHELAVTYNDQGTWTCSGLSYLLLIISIARFVRLTTLLRIVISFIVY